MNSGAIWVRMKAHRWVYTLSILATLAVGILIGTVISAGVKGKEGQKGDVTPLSLPAAQPIRQGKAPGKAPIKTAMADTFFRGVYTKAYKNRLKPASAALSQLK